MTLSLTSYKARVVLSTTSKHMTACICDALAPDLRLLPSTDSRAELSLRETELVFNLEAADLASLRASINSYLRLADASYRCLAL